MGASVGGSVGGSMGGSVGASVGDSVGGSVSGGVVTVGSGGAGGSVAGGCTKVQPQRNTIASSPQRSFNLFILSLFSVVRWRKRNGVNFHGSDENSKVLPYRRGSWEHLPQRRPTGRAILPGTVCSRPWLW